MLELNLKSACIHADLKPKERLERFKQFKNDAISILVGCTNTFGQGINIKSVGLIINFDMPSSPAHYLYRLGHDKELVARAFVISFITNDTDTYVMQSIEERFNIAFSRDRFFLLSVTSATAIFRVSPKDEQGWPKESHSLIEFYSE